MALQLSHTTAGDVTAAEAYHRITWFCGGSAEEPIQIELSIYKDAAARAASKQPIDRLRLLITIDLTQTGNIVSNVYGAIKLIAPYDIAIDV